ncbi:MAG: hypothetical protein PHR35_17620, partial [Kiritimatiellae bacterium]|nr:hypothetical protein [Kiritimatiellia bacterium]
MSERIKTCLPALALTVQVIAGSVWAGPPAADTVPLQPRTLAFVRRDASGVYRLVEEAFDPDDAGTVVIPFTQANRQMASAVINEDENTRRQILSTEGEFFFRAYVSGTYHVALAAEFPVAGTWNYTFVMDDSQAAEGICSVENGQAQALHLLPMDAMRRTLDAGVHQVAISIPGGGDVRALLLSREPFAASKIKQAPVAKPFVPSSGTIVFAPLEAVGLAVVQRLETPGSDGRIVWEIASPDRGNTPFELDKPPTNAVGAAVRATLHRDAGGRTVMLRAPYAVIARDERLIARLENGDVAVEFDRRTGRMGRIADRRENRYYRQMAALPFRLADWSPETGQPVEWDASRFVCENVRLSPERKLVVSYRDAAADAKGRVVRVTVAADGPALRWRLRIENRASSRIRLVRFPYLSDLAAGSDAADDRIAWAGLYDGPVVGTPAWHRDYHTPQVMFMDLYDEDGGLYVGAHDPTGETDRMLMRPAAGPPPFAYAFEVDKTIKPGAVWESQDYVVAPHRGDWHAGADIYRAWYRQTPRESRDPAWLRPDYMGAMNIELSKYEPFGAIADWWRMARWRGTFYLKMNNVGGDGFGNNFFPYPNPYAGSTEALRQAVRWVNARGGQTDGYMNCRYWTPAWADGSAIGHTPRWMFPANLWLPDMAWSLANAVHSPDGTPPGLGSGETPHRPFQQVVNMSFRSRGWYDFWQHWFERYGEWGLNIYWDQAMVSNYRCDLPDEACRWPEANYQQALMRTCRDAIARARRHKPDCVVRGEGLSDRQMRVQNLCWIFRYPTPIYRYTHPDHVLDMTLYNEDYDVDWQLAYLFHMRITGGNLWGKGWGTDMRRVTDLRAATRNVSHLGRYMDNVGLTGESEGLQARWVLLNEGERQAIEVHTLNRGESANRALTLKWPLPTVPRAAFVYTLGTRVAPWPFAVTNGVVRFDAPTNIVASLLFVAGEEAGRALRAHAFVPMDRPGRDVLLVALANASPDRQTGQVVFGEHPALKTVNPQTPFALAPGEAVTLEIPVDGAPDLSDFAEAPLSVVTAGGRSQALRPWVAPTVLNGRFEDDVTGDRVTDYWRDGVRAARAEGGYCLLVPAKGDYSPRG